MYELPFVQEEYNWPRLPPKNKRPTNRKTKGGFEGKRSSFDRREGNPLNLEIAEILFSEWKALNEEDKAVRSPLF